MPGPDRHRPRRARRVRCEACLDVLTLRHAWDTATCSCGALSLSGRPPRPVVHWLGRPGGGWSDVDDEIGQEAGPGVDAVTAPTPDGATTPTPTPTPTPTETPRRRLGFEATTAPAGRS